MVGAALALGWAEGEKVGLRKQRWNFRAGKNECYLAAPPLLECRTASWTLEYDINSPFHFLTQSQSHQRV